MAIKDLKLATYTRDPTIRQNKFAEFDRLIGESIGGDFNAVAVSRPEVLGDTHDELVMNLNKIAEAELALVIVPPSARGKTV